MILRIKKSYLIIKEVFRLSFVLAKAGFKLKHEGSYLGIFWYLLNPILTFSLISLIFSDRLGGNIPYYSIYLLVGIIMFNFFHNTTVESSRSIIDNNRGLIKSINFPREALIMSIVFKNLFSHLFEIILLIMLIIYFKISMVGIFYYLILLIFFSSFIFGISLILSSLSVYFVDIKNIWSFFSRLIWFGTPIFYAIEGQERLLYLNLFNPMYYFITIARDVVIYNKSPEFFLTLMTLSYMLFFLGLGIFIFNRLKVKISEKI